MKTLFNAGKDNKKSTNKSKSRRRVHIQAAYILAAITAIKEHIDKDPFKFKGSLDILNDLNSPNRNILEKEFRKAYGDGIKTYQVKARLNEAKRLIIKGKPKKMIAHKCYYASPSAFTTAFKRQFGMTPTQWEHSLKIKEIEDMLNDE